MTARTAVTARVHAACWVAWTDLRRRARSPRYLVVPLLVAVLAGGLTGGDTQLRVGGGYTPVPNAALYGAVVATFGTLVLALVGFSFVRGRVREDRESGVGELVATAPVGDATYLLGRWLGYVATLAVVTAVLALGTLGAFLQHGTGPLDAWALGSPFLFVTLPTMAAVAGVAVASETTRLFRGSLGTAVYFFGVVALVSAGQNPAMAPLDPAGAAVVRASLLEAIPETVTGLDRLEFALGSPREATAFHWDGVDWSLARVLGRAPLVGVGALALAVGVQRFDRFRGEPGLLSRLLAPVTALRDGLSGRDDESSDRATDAGTGPDADDTNGAADPAVGLDLAPVTPGTPSLVDPRVLAAECRLALRGRRWWWYAAVAMVVVLGAFAPPEPVRHLLVPVAFLLPLSVWSGLGVRETRHRTTELVYASPRPAGQLVAVWASGTLVALVVASGALLTLGLAGAVVPAASVAVATAAVPAVALALGVWTGTSRTFEIGYLVAWYLGPMNGVGPLDFVGATGTRPAVTAALVAVGVLALLAGSWRRLRTVRA